MAIYDDDFQGYSVGSGAPFGSWQLNPSAITNVIVLGNAPTGMTKSFRLNGDVVLDPTVPGYITSFTSYVAIFKQQRGNVLVFSNGPNSTGHKFQILAVRVETDSTISVTGPATEVLANSGDAWFDYNSVNFLQVNVQLSDVMVSGVNHIHIVCKIALNGIIVIDLAVTTSVAVTDLANGTSEVNRFELQAAEAYYSAYTLDTLQSIVSYPHPGSPKARVNQAVVEVDILPDTTKLQVQQAVVEVDCLQAQGIRPDYIHARHRPGD
jgi:hypothetical protein